jgi:hypothetical protein
MNTFEAIERAMLKAGAPDPGPDGEAMLQDALQAYCREAAQDPHRRHLVAKDFSITVTSGVGSLTTHRTASEPLIDEGWPFATVTISGETSCWLPDKASLQMGRPKIKRYHTVAGDSLLVRNTDGSLTSFTGTATANVAAVRPVGNIVEPEEERVVELLAGIMAGGPQGGAQDG